MLSPCFLPSSATCYALSSCCMIQCISVFDNYIMCPISAVQMLAFHRYITLRISKYFIFIIFAVFPFIQTYKNFNEIASELESYHKVSLFPVVISVDWKTTWVKQLWYIPGSLSYQRLCSHNVCAWKSHCFLISVVYS